MMPTSNRYIVNTLSNLLGNVTIALLMMVSTPILIRILGNAQYGLFRVAFISLVGYAALLDMGMTNAVRRHFADAIHQNGPSRGNEVLSVSYRLYGGLSLLAFLASASTIYWLPPLVNTPPQYLASFRWLLLAAGLYASSQLLVCPARSVLVAFARYDLFQLSSVISRVMLIAGGIALAYFWRKDLLSLAFSGALAATLTLGLTIILAKRVFPELHMIWSYRDRALRKAMLAFGGYAMMATIGPIVVYQTQDLLIAGFLSPAKVTPYAIAAILMTEMRAVGNAVASPIFPIASRLKAEGNEDGLRRLMLNGTLRTLWVWGAIAGPLIVFAKYLIAAWVGPEYTSSTILVWILLVGNFGTIINRCPSQILTASGSIKWLGYLQIHMAFGSISLMLGVLSFTGWGLVGVALSVSLPIAVRSGILVPIYAAMQLRLPPLRYFVHCLGRAGIYLVVGACLAWLLITYWQPQSLLSVLMGFAGIVLVSLLAGLWIMFPKPQRKSLVRNIGCALDAAWSFARK